MEDSLTFELLWRIVIEMQSIPLIAIIAGVGGWLTRLPKMIGEYRSLSHAMRVLEFVSSTIIRPNMMAMTAAVLCQEAGFSPTLTVVVTAYAAFDSDRWMNIMTSIIKFRLGGPPDNKDPPAVQ